MGALVLMESSLKYHPDTSDYLTMVPYRDLGHCLVGSLTGAVASQKVTEACEGRLRTVRNRS